MTIFFRLLFAHIISDFFFQTDSLIKGKLSRNRKRYVFQAFHSLTHAVTAYLLLAQWCNWLVPVVVFLAHILMDYIKIEYMPKGLKTFLVDQFVHFTVICALWVTSCEELQYVNTLVEELFCSGNVWVVFTAYLLALKPTSVLLSLFTKQWTTPDAGRKVYQCRKVDWLFGTRAYSHIHPYK